MSRAEGEGSTARGGGARGRAGAEEQGPRGAAGDAARREGRAEGARVARVHGGAAPRGPAFAVAERARDGRARASAGAGEAPGGADGGARGGGGARTEGVRRAAAAVGAA